jgi:predicted 3-demethylubiquinone-9 3-methyltransferase (glyoxalase superfamily)
MTDTKPAPRVHRISPFLWFDTQAEEAANYYVSIFPNSRITTVVRYPPVGQQVHGKAAGSVMTVAFELDGLPFTAINGGPQFTFNQAVSFVVTCDTQEDVDYFWDNLTAGGDPRHQQCGWLTDKFGMVWQVVPQPLVDMITHTDAAKSQRAFQAMLTMKKLDIAAAQGAFEGV